MSNYKAPEPEMHVPIPDLDLKSGRPSWSVFKVCEDCGEFEEKTIAFGWMCTSCHPQRYLKEYEDGPFTRE